MTSSSSPSMSSSSKNASSINIDSAQLLTVASRLVEQAEPGEQLEVACGHSVSTTVRVYGGEVESFTNAESHGVGVRVIRDGREGFASAGTLDPALLDQTLADARDNSNYAEADPDAGIAEPDGIAAVDIDLWREEILSMSSQEKIDLAIQLERRVLDGDDRISGVRVSAYGDSAGAFALASSAGIRARSQATSASLSVQALADDDDRTQTGSAYDGARKAADLDLEWVADRAVSRAIDLIGASKPTSRTVSLVLDPHLSATVIGLIAGTLTGDRIIKKRSPFVDRVGEEVAATSLSFIDDPTDPDSLGADSHDGEGLACRSNPLVVDGVLQGYLFDSYNGRRAGTGSTGSAVRGTRGLPSPGIHALSVAAGTGGSLDELIAGVDEGVLVFSLAGLHSGVNPVSGDFSVGVEGRVIRNGQLAEPIGECTVGSTLQRLLMDISAVGSDRTHLPSGVSTPSLVIGDVMLSGATG